MIPGVEKVDHVSLRVPQLQRARAFYEALGGRVVHEVAEPGVRIVVIGFGPMQIELEEADSERRGEVDHIGIRVRRLEPALDALRRAGCPVEREPWEPTPGIRQATVLDPTGVAVQLTEIRRLRLARHLLGRRLAPGASGSTLPTWDLPFVPALYDAFVRLIYLPVGGEPELRRQAIQAMGPAAGQRVLELGCGTGRFTGRLVDAGALVTGIDGSEGALGRARRRAPAATLLRRDLRALALGEHDRYDLVLLGFVLHELEPAVRHDVLVACARALTPEGRVVIVDHAVPGAGGFASLWRRLLLWLEPPTVRQVIERGYDDELREAGLAVTGRFELARGTAALHLARPVGAC